MRVQFLREIDKRPNISTDASGKLLDRQRESEKVRQWETSLANSNRSVTAFHWKRGKHCGGSRYYQLKFLSSVQFVTVETLEIRNMRSLTLVVFAVAVTAPFAAVNGDGFRCGFLSFLGTDWACRQSCKIQGHVSIYIHLKLIGSKFKLIVEKLLKHHYLSDNMSDLTTKTTGACEGSSWL